jgi:hypothetical protein
VGGPLENFIVTENKYIKRYNIPLKAILRGIWTFNN